MARRGIKRTGRHAERHAVIVATTWRDDFVTYAPGYWEETRQGDARAANRMPALLERLLDARRADGTAREQLLELLTHDERGVRYAAAAGLGSAEQRAVDELHALALDQTGLIA